MSQRIDLNFAWEFTEHCHADFLAGKPAETAAVDLPHTCRETPYDYFDESVYQMVCGYRRRLAVPEDWAGKRVFLRVGAAGHSAKVYLDGVFLAEHRCGYTAFEVELTDCLVPGKEVCLAIEVDSRETQNIPPFGYVIDYMTYGGLYREVRLEVTEKTRIADVFARPSLPDRVESTVTLDGDAAGLTLRQAVFSRGSDVPLAEGSFAPGETPALTVPDARPWDTESPSLYTLRTELLRGGTVLDSVDTVFGFREVAFRADGFYLNGKRTVLRGLNRHQSYPYIGYAAPASLQRQDAEILKFDLGCNAVRTSHYPQSQHFVDRCDEIGLLVFTEIPGWQHIGDEAWQDQAVENVREMVLQYRNHPSIFLWGVRINESRDNDALYARTNALCRELDPTRPTSGVRYSKKSSFLEDVYAYNDFSHAGDNPGCEKKKTVTPDPDRAYLIAEYNGHMFPTKSFDPEEHRLSHALRHANVLDAAAGETDIAGTFGWCMFDYNTHRDFGSGDRICYHGVLDMFRNPKPAAAVYAAHRDGGPVVLEVSSTMDIGEHPGGNRGRIFLFTNADEVRFYKNGTFIRSFTHRDTPYRSLARPPIELDDFLGETVAENESFAPRQARYVKDILNHSARFGMAHLPPKILLKAGWLMLRYRMTFADAYQLYGKYIGNWGGAATEYRFEAVQDGVVKETVVRAPVTDIHLAASVRSTVLTHGETYDARLVQIAMLDQNGNVLPFYQGAVRLRTEGPIRILGPETAVLRGGLGGTLVRTTGEGGRASLTLESDQAEPVRMEFTVHVHEGGI